MAFAIVLGIVIDHLLTWLHKRLGRNDAGALPRRPAGPRPSRPTPKAAHAAGPHAHAARLHCARRPSAAPADVEA